MMNRALVLPLAAWAAALAVNPEKPRRARADAAGPFTVVEATIPQMRAALESGRVTSAELVRVLRTYAARKAAFGELLRQGKLPPSQPEVAE